MRQESNRAVRGSSASSRTNPAPRGLNTKKRDRAVMPTAARGPATQNDDSVRRSEPSMALRMQTGDRMSAFLLPRRSASLPSRPAKLGNPPGHDVEWAHQPESLRWSSQTTGFERRETGQKRADAIWWDT